MTGQISELKRWAASADVYELIDAAEVIRDAQEKKSNENRVSLLRVEADKVVVGHFPIDQIDVALRYLLTNVNDVGTDVHIGIVRIPASEVHAHLTDRWWKSFAIAAIEAPKATACATCEGTGMANVDDPADSALVLDDSPIGQPLRFALGMGAHEPLPDWRVAVDVEAIRVGAIRLRNVVLTLRETGNFRDEEGEDTDDLEALLNVLESFVKRNSGSA